MIATTAALRWSPAGRIESAAARDDDVLFASADWARVLATLGSEVWSGEETGTKRRVLLLIVRRGPVAVGLPGFPATPAWFATACRSAGADVARSLSLPRRVDMLRINSSSLDGDESAATGAIAQPETTVPDLASWPIRNARRMAKDIAAARRHGLAVAPAATGDADAMFSAYARTVSRRGGVLRYSRDYFQRLLTVAASRRDVCARVARAPDGRFAGFALAVINEDRGYYLHGAFEPEFRAAGTSDLLLDSAMRWARDAGAHAFTLMASPADQPGLVRFKQKWGERDGAWSTLDQPIGLRGRALAALLAWRARRRQARQP